MLKNDPEARQAQDPGSIAKCRMTVVYVRFFMPSGNPCWISAVLPRPSTWLPCLRGAQPLSVCNTCGRQGNFFSVPGARCPGCHFTFTNLPDERLKSSAYSARHSLSSRMGNWNELCSHAALRRLHVKPAPSLLEQSGSGGGGGGGGRRWGDVTPAAPAN